MLLASFVVCIGSLQKVEAKGAKRFFFLSYIHRQMEDVDKQCPVCNELFYTIEEDKTKKWLRNGFRKICCGLIICKACDDRQQARLGERAPCANCGSPNPRDSDLKGLVDMHASKGRSWAIYAQGKMFELGENGSEQSYERAAECFLKCATEFDNLDAHYALGALYAGGQGVPQSLEDSFRHYLIAADKGI